jgi:hypothetical protein
MSGGEAVDSVNISARARDKIPRLTRTPSGTRTFFGSGSQITVNLMITRAFLNKRARESLETFSEEL